MQRIKGLFMLFSIILSNIGRKTFTVLLQKRYVAPNTKTNFQKLLNHSIHYILHLLNRLQHLLCNVKLKCSNNV